MIRDDLIALCLANPPIVEADEVFNVQHGGDCLATLGISWREISTEDGDKRMAGICLVATCPGYRRLGLMSTLMGAAITHAIARGVRLAGLWTDRPGVYASLGFRPVVGIRNFMVSPIGPDGTPTHVPVITDTRGSW